MEVKLEVKVKKAIKASWKATVYPSHCLLDSGVEEKKQRLVQESQRCMAALSSIESSIVVRAIEERGATEECPYGHGKAWVDMSMEGWHRPSSPKPLRYAKKINSSGFSTKEERKIISSCKEGSAPTGLTLVRSKTGKWYAASSMWMELNMRPIPKYEIVLWGYINKQTARDLGLPVLE